MMDAQIFLAAQRGCSQTAAHRSLHSLNFRDFRKEHLKPFFSLESFNEDTVKEQHTVSFSLDNRGLFILPTIGEIIVRVENEPEIYLEPGECIFINGRSCSEVKITNPFESELVNFINCWFTINESVPDKFITNKFDLDKTKNKLVTVVNFSGLKIHIGKYTGRTDCTHSSAVDVHGLFTFVIDGAFEFQNRLLQPQDALALHQPGEVEFEALSNDAVLLLIEV